MRLYLAADYDRRIEMRQVAAALLDMGHQIVGRWILSDDDDDPSDGIERGRIAAQNLADVDRADAIVLFTCRGRARGGKFVEFGWAAGRGKRAYVVGPSQNIYCDLPGAVRCEDFPALCRALEVEAAARLARGNAVLTREEEEALAAMFGAAEEEAGR